MTPKFRFGDVTQVPLFFQKQQADRPRLDMSGAKWVGPAQMVSLAAYAQMLSFQGYAPVFVPPEDMGVANYMSRMGVRYVLEQLHIESYLPIVKANKSLNQESLVELQSFSDESEITSLIEIILNRGLPLEVVEPLCVALSEMGNNVAQHARVDFGFIAAQVTNNGNNLKFAVADSGVGVLGTLKGKGAKSHRQALEMAVAGVSEMNGTGRGQGFSAMRKAISSVGGVAHLLTGDTMATWRANQGVSYETYFQSFQGTIFDAMIPAQKTLRSQGIGDQFLELSQDLS